MKLSFHPEAEREFIEATNYYERSENGLGRRFALEVTTTIRNILAYPDVWPKVSINIHRCLVHHFPYGILYHFERDEVLILAVMHLHRHPDYWKERN